MDQENRTQLVVRGLGRSEIVLGSLTLVPDAGMLFPLALVLAQRAGERITRAALRELIWPSVPEKSGRHSLRQGLYRLHVAGLVHDERGDEIVVDPAVVASDISLALLPGWPERADTRMIESAATVLPGFAPDDGSALGEFTEQLRSRVAAQYRRAVMHRIAAARREGRWREVGHWGLMCLQADSLNEEATLARAEAEAMVGAKNEALEILDTYMRELGDRARVIGLPARMLRRRVSELPDTTGRRVAATSAPFVGRHDLLAAAQDTLAAARGGSATALWLVGPAGIGKSRLLKEIERASKMAGWTVVSGDARPSFADRPSALLTDVLPELLEAPGALGAAPHALSLMRQMGTVNTDEEPLEPEEARGRQHAVYHSWVDLMDAVLGETALALLLDDVQWSDPLTLVMLARFMESRPKARLAVILSARRVPTRDDQAAARLLSAAHERVGPLSDDEIRDFTRVAGLAADEQFEEVTRQLGRASGGNPLFLSHLVHRHQWRHEQAELPNDLASLIDLQLRGLSKKATRLLQACALLGQHALLPRIERSLGVEAPSLVSAFGELDDMLALPTDPGVPLAPHDLWTERVRRGMTSGVFRSLAVSVARVLEADAVADGGIELYWDAARLYQESGEKQLAFATMMRCAEYLMRTGATAEASRAYLAASELALSPAAATEALLGRVRALQILDDWNDVIPTIHRVRSLDADHATEIHRDLDLISFSARWALTASDTSIFEGLREIASDRHLRSELRLRAALLGMAAADNAFDAHSIRWFAKSVQDATPESTSGQLTKAKIRVVFETAIGCLEDAEEAARGLLALASQHETNPSAVQEALRFASYPPRRLGNFDVARKRLLDAADISERRHFGYSLSIINDMLAGLHLDYGMYLEAVVHLEAAEASNTHMAGSFRRTSTTDTWALVLAGLRRWQEAKQYTSHPNTILARGRCHAQFMGIAATLLVASHFDDREVAVLCLDAIDGVRDRLFLHAGKDQIAWAYASALMKFRSASQSQQFAEWYLNGVRRDRLKPPSELVALLNG